MRHSHTVWVLSLIVFLALPGLSQSRKPATKRLLPAYHLIVLPLAEANGINDNGQVVGIRYAKTPYVDTGDIYTKAYQSYVWQKGRLRWLGSASTHPRIRAVSINNKGDIAGDEEDVTNGPFPYTFGDAYFWSQGRKMRLTPPILHSAKADATFVLGINSKGTVVGFSGMAFVADPNDPEESSHAVVWKRGKLTDLGWGEAKAINDQGQIVGGSMTFPDQLERAVLWSQGQKTVLGYGTANAINNHGQVVGTFANGHGFLSNKGRIIDLGKGDALAINDLGQVLLDGDWSDSYHAVYLWQKGKRGDLNHLVPALAHWSNLSVSGLNNQGAVIGYGTYRNQERAFLLLPNSAPSSPRPKQRFSRR